LKYDGTRAETRFRLSAKRTNPFKSAGASVQSTTVSRGVRISGSNAGYTMFRDSVKSTGYPLHSPVSPSIPLSCVAVCHHISTGVYISVYTRTAIGICHASMSTGCRQDPFRFCTHNHVAIGRCTVCAVGDASLRKVINDRRRL
jgi:hypothetical protein